MHIDESCVPLHRYIPPKDLDLNYTFNERSAEHLQNTFQQNQSVQIAEELLKEANQEAAARAKVVNKDHDDEEHARKRRRHRRSEHGRRPPPPAENERSAPSRPPTGASSHTPTSTQP